MPGPGLAFTALSFLLVIGPLIFVHEMGHYWVGRWCGVHAEAFSIGFGPEVGHWTDRRGTRWRIGALPLGGYVRFAGDMGIASEPDPKWLELPANERNRCFHVKPVWQRALIVFAGPAVNLLFAALILGGFAYVYGERVTPATVGAILKDSAAEKAGLRAGDRILSMDGDRIENYDRLFLFVQGHVPGDRVTLAVQRGGQRLTVPLTLGARVEPDRFGNKHQYAQIGIQSGPAVFRKVGLVEAPIIGLRRTGEFVALTARGAADLITGRRPLSEMGGPLKTAQVSGETAALGPIPLIYFIAFVSINLGFINLLPIPMLDGGHLFFYGVEAIQRKPVSPRVQEIAFRSGLAFILGLMLLVTINDLGSFGLWRGLSRLRG